MRNKINITNIGDPYILLFEDIYYLYATSKPDGFMVRTSEDLCNWSEPTVCYLKNERSFGSKWFWAPEVYYLNNKFYMYYTAWWGEHEKETLRIGLAISDSPTGSFVDVFDKKPLFDPEYGLLDGHLLCDDDGRNYLYYSCAGEDNIVNGHKEADIFVVELANDYITPVSEHKCVICIDQEWETRSGHDQYWTEGPFIVKHEGKYHMMYSANPFFSKHYSVGGAVSDSPTGPFVKYADNPILHFIENVMSGPGHNSVLKAKDGNLYCVYHAHTDYNKPNGNRQVYISPMSFVDGKIKVDFM